MLLSSHPAFAGLRVYDARAHVNVSSFRMAFNRLDAHADAAGQTHAHDAHDVVDARAVVRLFRTLAGVSAARPVHVSAVRMRPRTAKGKGHASLARDATVGILCVAREGVTGGLDEFEIAGPSGASVMSIRKELSPGFFALYEEREGLVHRTTRLAEFEGEPGHGYRDVIVVSAGGGTWPTCGLD
jgi:hypothetical protein